MSFEKLEDYDESFIIKLLSCLVNERDYLVQMHDAIDIEYFDNICHKWVVDKTLEFYHKYKTNPSPEFLTAELKKFKKSNDKNVPLAKEIYKLLEQCVNEEFEGLNYVKEEFGNFCRERAVINVLYEAPDLVKFGKFQDIQIKLNSAIRIGEPKLSGHDYNNELVHRYREETKLVLPFQIKELNDLFPNKIGISGGSVVANLGAGGSGKSWFGVDWASDLLKNGYNVLYFNLESSFDYVGKRFDANLNNISLDEVSGNIDEIQQMLDSLEGRLHIKDCTRHEKSLSFMQNYTKKLEEEQDFVPHLVIIDYFQKMNGTGSDETTSQKKILADIMDWAKDEGFVIYSPVPIGRLGADNMVVTEKDVGGTFQLIYDLDFVISWSRHNIMNIIKNKNGKGMGTLHEFDFNSSTGHFKYLDEYFEESSASKVSPKQLSNLSKNLGKKY